MRRKRRHLSAQLQQTEQSSQQHLEQLLAAAFRLSPDAMAINAVPGHQFLDVNDRFTQLTGYSRAEMVGKTAPEMNLWVDPHHRARVMAKLGEGLEVREEEFHCRTKSGEVRLCQFSGKLIDQDGQRCLLTLARDITAQRKMEDEVRASEERFRSLIQNLQVGIILLGREAEAKFANQAALDMFGLSHDQVFGHNISQFFFTPVREDGTTLTSSMLPGARAIETRQTIRNEILGWRRADSNQVLWTLLDAIPQITEQGEVANVILSLTNITDLKSAQEALSRSEQLFRTLVENLHAGVALFTPDQVIQFANRAALETFGLTQQQTFGKKLTQLGFTPLNENGAEMPVAMRPTPRAVASGKAVLDEVIGWRRSGSDDVFWIHGGSVPLFDENGDLEKVIASFIDITKQKRAEESLRQLSTRLLQIQDEERRRIGRELHDVLAQSVMAVNLDLAQVARSSVPLDEQALRALSEARGMLGEMSQEIRTLAYTLHPPALDELGLATALQEYAAGFSDRSGIALEMDLEPDFERLSLDVETALFRIAQESLLNIQRHSGSSMAKISLRRGSEFVELQISDLGRGIDRATLERRGGAGTRRLGVGILGMRERVMQLNGRLDVESNTAGTTIRAMIPIAIEVSNAASHPCGG